jgi:hypothetical protein
MKMDFKLKSFLLAGAAVLLPNSAAFAKDVSSDNSSPLQATNVVGGIKIDVSNFFILFAEHPDVGFGKGVSVSPTDILTFKITLPSDVVFEVAPRTDWNNRRPGVLKSQYVGLKDLDVQLPVGNTTLQVGTVGLWVPKAGIPLNKDSQWIRDHFAFGGPTPGLVGLRDNGKLKVGNVDVHFDVIASTGARGLTGSLADNGDPFPSRCDRFDRVACGLVVGAAADISSTKVPGLVGHLQATHIGNTAALRDETRVSVGAEYQRKLGNGFTGTSQIEYDHASNHRGGDKPETGLFSTLGVNYDMSKKTQARIYASVTDLKGAQNQTYAIAGAAITQKIKGGSVSVEFYGGRSQLKGLLLTYVAGL